MPIDNEINENDDRVSIPCNSREILDKPLPGENDRNPANIKEGLVEGENNKNDEANKPDECNKDSMHNLDHLAQVCCDKEGLGFENLSFTKSHKKHA